MSETLTVTVAPPPAASPGAEQTPSTVAVSPGSEVHIDSHVADLKTKTLRSGGAKLVSQVAVFALRLVSLMVLARLLSPKDFGLVGMVTVVTGIFSLFKDAGLSMVTIQRPTITHRQLSTLFWLNVLVGVVLAVLTVAIGPALARFYDEPRLTAVASVMAAAFVLNAAGVQHSALLQRQMRFVMLAAIEVVSLIASIAVGVWMAAWGYGYWALVAMAIVVPAVSTAAVWWAAGWMPGSPGYSLETRSMIRFGGAVTLNSSVMYLVWNVDKVIVGRLWGAEALGFYGRAFQLINIPTENLNAAVGYVAVSALSRLHDDFARFKNYFLRAYSVVLAMTIPVTAACALFANEIVIVLLGPKWTGSVQIFRYLTPTILAFAMLNPLTWMLFASGRVRRSLQMSAVIVPVVILGYAVGARSGPLGLALGYSTSATLIILPMIAFAVRGSGITLTDILKAVAPPILSAVTATLVTLIAQRFIEVHRPLPTLLVGGGILALTYAAMLFLVFGQLSVLREMIMGLRNRAERGPSIQIPALEKK